MNRPAIVLLGLLVAFGAGPAQGQTSSYSANWSELTGPDFVKAMQVARNTCILPVGIIEKHGPAGPLATDLINARFRPIEELNTAADDLSPFLLPDCATIYFASNRDGNFDLYRATRDSNDTPWNAPKRIDELATPAAEMDPWVSLDERHILFSTNERGGSDVVEAFR